MFERWGLTKKGRQIAHCCGAWAEASRDRVTLREFLGASLREPYAQATSRRTVPVETVPNDEYSIHSELRRRNTAMIGC